MDIEREILKKLQESRKPQAGKRLKEYDENDRESELQEAKDFIDSINVKPLNDKLSEVLGVPMNFQMSGEDVKLIRGDYIIVAEDPTNYASECGVMSNIYREVKLSTFNSRLSRDDKTGAIRLWMTIHFQFTYVTGGSNGTPVLASWYENGNWTFRVEGRG